jgi:hypothetical protein
MAAILQEIIPTQGFEIVAHRICEIITEEIANQQSLQNLTETCKVFLERIEPFTKEEDVMVTVAYRESIPEGNTQSDYQGFEMFFIDLFISGGSEDDDFASVVMQKKLYKYLGLIRYILSSGKMPTLGLPPGLIGGKYIKKITLDTDYSNFGNHSNYDWAYIRFARIMFMVRIQERTDLWQGIPLLGNDTQIHLENTTQGLQFTFNNT